MTELLQRVRSSALRRKRAIEEYRRAVLAAHRAHSENEIARAAGVSQPVISRMLTRLRRERQT